jgi:3-oxoisoapionate decarboxylase
MSIEVTLDEHGLGRAYTRRHPDVLEGRNKKETDEDIVSQIQYAKAIGADIVRAAGSSLFFRFGPHGPQSEKLSDMFSKALAIAEVVSIKIADKNHTDYKSDEMFHIIKNINSPSFYMIFDIGNFIRVLADSLEVIAKLAKYTFKTHIKDLKPQKGEPVSNWYFFACTPVKDGLIDNQELVQILKDLGYKNALAFEKDYHHADYNIDEGNAVVKSIEYLKKISRNLN